MHMYVYIYVNMFVFISSLVLKRIGVTSENIQVTRIADKSRGEKYRLAKEN